MLPQVKIYGYCVAVPQVEALLLLYQHIRGAWAQNNYKAVVSPMGTKLKLNLSSSNISTAYTKVEGWA